MLWNLYGITETTVVCCFQLVNITANAESIPIGHSLPNYRYIILDEFFQLVVIDQEGEIFIGGVGVFARYLGLDDLTMKALIEINGELFYRTGDLARMNNDGTLHYIGRKDFQIKLHGQRLELGEIERCLLSASVSACVVMKWGNDHLVAYIQTSNTDEKQVREHCQSHLPPHMIPSKFVVLEQLPLNSNGKVDRKRLPAPELSSFISSPATEANIFSSQFEKYLHNVWCQVLRCIGKQIPTTANFFSIGGHSLLFIELYHCYQSLFSFDTRELSISLFLEKPTIARHSQLLQTVTKKEMKSVRWHTLHINQGNQF